MRPVLDAESPPSDGWPGAGSLRADQPATAARGLETAPAILVPISGAVSSTIIARESVVDVHQARSTPKRKQSTCPKARLISAGGMAAISGRTTGGVRIGIACALAFASWPAALKFAYHLICKSAKLSAEALPIDRHGI